MDLTNWTEYLAYQSVHKWVRRHYPKSGVCDECGKKARTEYANISGEYRRDRSDFNELCRPCHVVRDNLVRNLGDASAKKRARTHCRHGHEYTERNTYYDKQRGYRSCRQCKAIAQRARTRARAEARAAGI